MNGDKSFGFTIGLLFIEEVAGLIAGVSLGLLGWFFKFIEKYSITIYLKTLYCLACAVAFAVAAELS